jgi:hypothetical protein
MAGAAITVGVVLAGTRLPFSASELAAGVGAAFWEPHPASGVKAKTRPVEIAAVRDHGLHQSEFIERLNFP